MHDDQPVSRGRVWIALVSLLVAVSATVLAVLLIREGDGGPGAASAYELTNAAAPEDAEVAWQIDAPSEVYSAASVGEVTVVSYGHEGLVAYDEDGTEQWREDTAYGFFEAPSADRLYVMSEDSMRALSPEGAELWSLEDVSPSTAQEVYGRIVVETTPVSDCVDEECTDTARTVQVLDAVSGKEVASVDGDLLAVGDSGFLIAGEDGDELRMFDLSGDEQWSVETDSADETTAAIGDGLVLASTRDSDEGALTAFDPEGGEQLWSEHGGRVYSPGPGGTVAVQRGAGDAAELVFYDADGEAGSVPLDGDLVSGPGPAVTAYPYPYRIEAQGEVFVDSVSNQVVGSDLEVMAEYDQQIVDITEDGPYLLAGDRLTLGSWDSGKAQYSVELEDPIDVEDPDGDRVWSLDGAVAVAAGDTLKIYR